MGIKNFNFTILGSANDVIQVTFREKTSVQELTAELSQFFYDQLSQGIAKWILDFSNMPFPSTTLIAFVISATFQARLHDGDIKIVFTKDSTRNNFATFSPLSYLEFDTNPTDAFNGFYIAPPKEGSPKNSWEPVDIAEPPIIEETPKQNSPRPNNNILSRQDAETDAQLEGREPAKRTKVQPNIRPARDANGNQSVEKHYFKTESIASNLYKICDFIVDHSRAAGMDEKQIVKSKIAVYEACLNVIEHAYHSRPDNWIEVWVEYSNKVFKIIIQDHGLSFDKREPKEYDVEAAVEKRQTGGFGLHIIERSMDDVTYNADEVNGNQLILTKFLK